MSLCLDLRREPAPLCARPGCDRTTPRRKGAYAEFCGQTCRDASYSERRANAKDYAPPAHQVMAWLNQHRPTVVPFPTGFKLMLRDRIVGEGETIERAVQAAMEAAV